MKLTMYISIPNGNMSYLKSLYTDLIVTSKACCLSKLRKSANGFFNLGNYRNCYLGNPATYGNAMLLLA